jgi:cyclin-dependent kinase-like
MGPLPKFLQEAFLSNPRFIGLKFPDVSKPETIEKRYLGKVSKVALSLITGLLIMDPYQRLTA